MAQPTGQFLLADQSGGRRGADELDEFGPDAEGIVAAGALGEVND